MRVLEFYAENIKRISVLDMTPDGELVEISGPNGSGKTSALDALMWGLEGKAAIQWDPIQKGKQTGMIRIAIGDDEIAYRITRKLKKGLHDEGDETYLERFTQEVRLEDANGGKMRSPQAVLDSMLGAITLDPLEFARADPKGRIETLKGLVTGFDFQAYEQRRLKLYDERTAVGREADRLAAHANTLTDGKLMDRVDPVDTRALVKQLADAAEQARETAAEQRRRDQRKNLVTTIASQVKQNADQIERIHADAERRITELNAANRQLLADAQAIGEEMDALPALPAPPDTRDIEEQISLAEMTNVEARKFQAWHAAKGEAEVRAADYARLTRSIERLDATMHGAIEAADLPVPGIALGERDVLLDGLPFEQASHAQQIRASMGLAMAGNPDIKIVCIREGAFLDKTSFGLVRDLAKERGFQVFIETIEPRTAGAIILENGKVKE